MKKSQLSRHELYLRKIHVQIDNVTRKRNCKEKDKSEAEDTLAVEDFDLEAELMKKFDELFGAIDDE